jgi:hypothetical protein
MHLLASIISSPAALSAAEERAMNQLPSKQNSAFNGFVGTLAVTVASLLCIALGGCTSHATGIAVAPELHGNATPPAQQRQLPQQTGDETQITPMETVGALLMN